MANFNNKPTVRSHTESKFLNKILTIAPTTSKTEPRACTIKYFIPIHPLSHLTLIRKINLSMFNSSPTQALNNLSLEPVKINLNSQTKDASLDRGENSICVGHLNCKFKFENFLPHIMISQLKSHPVLKIVDGSLVRLPCPSSLSGW